jgi:hypothetical protein
MPLYEITAPNGKRYRIEGPEGASREDVARAVLAQNPDAAIPAPELTMGGYARESLKAIPRGFVGGLESAALGAAALLPGDTGTGFEKTAREGIKGLAERFKPSVAAGYEEAIPVKLAEALGSMGTLLVPGGAAGLAAKGLGAAQGAQRVAQLAATTPIAGAMGAGEARERAVAAGATPEQIQTATTAGVVPGLAEMLPIERIFRKMPDELKGGILERVKRALVTGGFEGAQEAASAVAQNLIARGIYKPSQELIEGVGEQAAYGVGAGAIVQFLVDAVAGRRAAPRGEAERAQRLEEERKAAEKQAVVDAFNALPGEIPADKVASADQKIAAIKADLKTLGKQQRGGSPEANALRQEIRRLQQAKQLAGYGGTQTDLFGEVGGGFTPLQPSEEAVSFGANYRRAQQDIQNLKAQLESAKAAGNISAVEQLSDIINQREEALASFAPPKKPEAATEQDKQQFLTNYRRALNDLEQISAQKAQAEEMNNQAAISYFGRLEQQRKAALDTFEEQGKKLGISEDELSVASRGVVGQLQALRNRQKTLNSKGKYDEAEALQPRITALEQQLAETTGTPLEREAGQRAERQAALFAEEMEAQPFPTVEPQAARPKVPPEVAAEIEQLQEQRAQLVQQKKATSGARANYIQNQINALDRDINALQQQGVVPAEYVSGEVFGEQALEQLTEAQEARLQQARDVFNAQRQQRREEAEAQQVGERSEQIAQVAPIEAMLIARGIKVEEPQPRSLKRKTLTKEVLAQPRKEKILSGLGKGVTTSSLRESIDNVNLTAPVQKLLGLTLPQEVSLADGQGAQTALPIIQQRIYELESARRTEFPSKTLVEDGKLTKDGQRLVGTEAALNVLRRFESVAKMSLPQPELTAAERTAVEKLGALPESRVTPAKAEELIDSLRQQRAAALSDFGAAIDGLRRGETTDPAEIEADKQRTRDLINNLMFLVTREAQLARVMNNKGAASPEQINQLVRPLRARLEQLLENAKPAGSQREADLMRLLADAIQNQDRAGIARYRQELARERQRLSTPTAMAEAFGQAGYQPPVIARGMTTGDITKLAYPAQRIAQGESELGRLQTEIAKTIYKLGYAQRAAKQRVTPPFALRSEMAAERKVAAVQKMLARAKAEGDKQGVARAEEILQGLRAPATADKQDAANKLDEALRRGVPEADRAVLERAADMLARGSVPKELVAEVNDVADSILMGREADLSGLQSELRRAEEALLEAPGQREIEMPEARSFMRATPANLKRAAFIQKGKAQERKRVEEAKKRAEEDKERAEQGLTPAQKIETAEQAFEEAKREANTIVRKEEQRIRDAIAKTNEFVKMAQGLRSKTFTLAQFKKLLGLNPTLDPAETKALAAQYEKTAEEQQQFDKDVFYNEQYLQTVLKANKQYQDALSRLAAAEKYIAELKTMGQAQALKKRLDAVENARKQTDRQLYDAHDDAAAKLKKWAEASGATTRTVTVERTPVKVSSKLIEATPEEKRGELLQTQARINELTEQIRSIAKTLGLKTKEQQALDPFLDADTVRKFDSKQRKLYNQRLELIDERAQLRERMVTRRSITTRAPNAEERAEKETSDKQEQRAGYWSRVLPRQYNEVEIEIAKVKKQIADLPKSKAAIKRLRDSVTQYSKEIGRIKKVNKNASEEAIAVGKSQIGKLRAQIRAINKALNKRTRPALETQLTALKDQRRDIAQRAVKYDVDLVARSTKQETQKAMQPLTRAAFDISDRETIYGVQRKRAAKSKVPEMRTEEEKAQEKESRERRKAARPLEDEGPVYGEPDFRDASAADTGVDTGEAKAVADRVQKALPEGVKFVYAPTLVDAPAAFKKALERSGRTAAKGAVMPDGTVIVVGEAHKSTADLQETIAHELIGHYGADMVLGKDGVQALTDKLFGRGLDHVAEVAVGLGIYPDVASARLAVGQSTDTKNVIVRELIARAAEGRRVAPTFAEKVKTFIRDMIGAVRGWFRNSGLSDLAKQDTKQIQALIRNAERELKNSRPGVYISPDGNAVFRDGASSDLDWMSDTSKDVLRRVVAQEKSAIDTVKGNVLGLTGVTQIIDRTAPFLAALQKGVAAGKISELEASQARYYLVAHDKRMNFTRNVAANGPLELKKFTEGAANYWMVQNKEGKDNPNLIKVFKALGESGMNADEAGRVFTLWLAAQRVKNEGIGVEALNYGKDKDGQPLLTAEKLRGVEKDVASQPKIAAAFEKARKEYNAYNAGLIDFAVQAGRISPEVAADLKRKKDYIPFYRKMGGDVKLFIGSEGAPITIGNLKDQPYLNELVGGDKPIQDVFTSSIQNTHMLTDMALRNITTKNVVYTLRKLGMLEAGRGGMVVRPKAGPASPLTIRFMENGEEKHAIVKTEGTIFEDIPAELLVKGLEGVKTTFPAALQLLGAPAKLLRKFVVLNPLYPVRQIIRDSLSAYGTSGADFNPVFDPVRNVVKAMIKKSPSAKELEERGLLGGQVLAGEGLEGMSTILRGVTGGKGNLSTALAWLESKSMYADVGTRVSAYDSYKRMGFNDLDAFLATNDIIDFNRRGVSPSLYMANTLIPFFNTQLQSLNVTYRAAWGRMPYEKRLDIQSKFVRRGIGMAAMTMLYAALMEDDEAYKTATPEQRLSSWFVRVPGLEEPVKIPIPFEYGLLFKALPEAVMNTVFGTDEGKPIAKGLGALAWQSVPNLIPQVGKPFIELAMGKDFFTLADIESSRMKRLDPTERFKDDTTELAKTLSSMGQGIVSPVQIDQFVRTTGTQLAVAIASMANPILRDPNAPPAPDKPFPSSKTPVVGSLIQPNDGNRIIDYVYEQMEKAEQARNTYNKLLEENRDAEADRYINKESGRIAMSDSVADFRKEMKDIRDAEEALKRDPALTPEQKRDELKELRKLKIDVATTYRDIIRQSSE